MSEAKDGGGGKLGSLTDRLSLQQQADLLYLLFQIKTWKLERLSEKTYPGDVQVTYHRDLTDEEMIGIKAWLKRGVCYRCRISKRRFFYAPDPMGAVQLALEDWEKVNSREGGGDGKEQ